MTVANVGPNIISVISESSSDMIIGKKRLTEYVKKPTEKNCAAKPPTIILYPLFIDGDIEAAFSILIDHRAQ